MRDPIAVVVVGIGHLGKHHLRLAATLPFWRCVGAFDTDTAKLEKLCAEFGVTPLRSLAETAAVCEAAIIATPTVTHREVAGIFLEEGKHVLVEKPLAATISEGEELVRLAQKRRVVLGVGHVEYYNPAVQALLARRPRPRYLETQRLSPFTRRCLDVDVVLDLMIHDLHIAQALNQGNGIAEIRAVGVPVLSSQVDLANVRLAFANGCVATLTASRVSSERVRKLRLFAPDTYYSVDYAEQTVSAYRLDRSGPEPQIVPLPVEVSKAEPLAQEHQAFAARIQGTKGALVTGEDGLAALTAARAIVDAIGTP